MNTTLQTPEATSLKAARQAFYDDIGLIHCAPLWEALKALIPKTPTSRTQVAQWRWQDTRAALDRAAGLITAEEAERRVLMLENPGMRGLARITESLYAGLQMIQPAEVAPPHRHSQGAIRFILEGHGAWTTADDSQVAMNVGDFVVTPSWTFHGHGNASNESVVWFDGLDLPIVDLMEAQFMEKPVDSRPQPNVLPRETPDLAESFDPPDAHGIARFRSDALVFGFASAARFLRDLSRSGPPHACWGHKLQYLTTQGRAPVPTMGAFLQMMPAGFQGSDYRSTDSTTYVIHQGTGRLVVDGQSMSFSRGDVVVCPSWKPYRFEVEQETIAFSTSSRPVQQFLNLWRESY